MRDQSSHHHLSRPAWIVVGSSLLLALACGKQDVASHPAAGLADGGGDAFPADQGDTATSTNGADMGAQADSIESASPERPSPDAAIASDLALVDGTELDAGMGQDDAGVLMGAVDASLPVDTLAPEASQPPALDAAGSLDSQLTDLAEHDSGAMDAPAPTGQLYVINAGANHDNAILRFPYPDTLTGNVAPAAKISGAATTLRCAHFGFLDVAHDRLYVADPCPPAGVAVFDGISKLNGAVAPTRRVSGSSTTFAVGPLEQNDTMMTVAMDSVRDLLYVSSAKQDNSVAEVAVFAEASTVSGDVAPLHVITTPPVRGRMFRFNHGVTVDAAHDRLFVASIGDNSILVFDSASTADGTVGPSRWLGGPQTGLADQSPLFTKLDPAGNLIVSCRTPGLPPTAGAIRIFAAANFDSTVTGNIDVAPLRTIAGSATTLVGPHMVDYRADTDELFVGNAWTGDVVVFAGFSTAMDNLAPDRILAGPATGLDIPTGANVPRTATGVMLDLTR